jgi:quinol monooxygenase YgiN
MGKMTVIGTFTCREGMADEMETALVRMVEAAHDEPGVEVYSYHRGDEDAFWFFALMSDEESMRDHGQSPAMQAAMATFAPLLAEPPKMTAMRPLAALGVDL